MDRKPIISLIRVHMIPLEESKISISIGNRPNVFLNGEYFPSQITECVKKIGAGEIGYIKLIILDDESQPLNLEIGTNFELRDGPMHKIADAEVIAIG